jgi:hypothetical protein
VAGVLRDHDLGEDRFEGLQETPYVLVAAGADHTDEPAEVERLLNGLGRRPRAGRVVGGVEHHGRGPAYDFEAPR